MKMKNGKNMIDSLRRKMIFVSAVSIAAVVFLIFLAIYITGVRQLNRTMDMLTDTISQNGGRFPPFDPKRPAPAAGFPPMDIITPETEFSTRFFTVWTDEEFHFIKENTESISSVTAWQARQYTQEILARGKKRGWISGYRYKIVPAKYGYLAVFVDGRMNRAMTRQSILASLVVLIGSSIVILLLIIAFSRYAVRPAAESYNKQKQFITDAGHELKTPLTLILSNIDIIENDFGKSEWLDDIRSEGERMAALINQLVTLSRMDEDHSNLTVSSFDLATVLSDTVSEFQPLAAESGMNLRFHTVPSVPYRGDEGLIRRLFAILLDNAVKYCDFGGTISVALSAKRHPVLIMENTYKNVNAAELNRLFDRFYRTDKARSRSGSFGIGLSMAKAIAKNHHGDITAYQKGSDVIGFKVVLNNI